MMIVTGIVMDNVMISGSDTVTRIGDSVIINVFTDVIGGSDVVNIGDVAANINIDDIANNVVNGLDVVISGSDVAFAVVIDGDVELSSVLH